MAGKSILEFQDNALLPLLFGEHNCHLSYIEQCTGIKIADKGGILTLTGNSKAIAKGEDALNFLWERIQSGQDVSRSNIDTALRFSSGKKLTKKKKMEKSSISIKTKKKEIHPRSPNQAEYIKGMLDNHLVFGLGPAGTGKTYLAVAVGVSLYLQGVVERLIFCRPAVEAGENLGFLPGDLQDKVDPYLRPVYDALHDMLPRDFVMEKIAEGEIEIAPLAFMRGRTLSNAFVILDEAQNTTAIQMKMFLTRMGEASRIVITGDESQTDLPKHIKSGLNDAVETLEHINEIEFMRFEVCDIIRHPLVKKIVQAYDRKSE